MNLAQHTSLALSLSCVMSFAESAWAQPVQGGDPAAARQFAMEGITASQRQDWPTVINRFEQAERRFHAPIHMRFLAMAYEHTNRLLDSANMWRALASEQLAPTASQPFRDAVLEAQRELPRIEGRLGRVQIDAPGAPSGAAFELDGNLVSMANLSAAQWVEPGPHRVSARAPGSADFTRSIDVAAGATERVAVVFAVTAQIPVTPRDPELGQGPTTTSVLRSNPLRVVGAVVGGVGVAALLGGVVTGLMANGAFATLEQDCPNRMCTTMEQLDSASGVNSLATVTNALLLGGGVLAVGGAVLFAVSVPRVDTVRVGLSPTGAQLSVRF